jgi:hypothetical protein
VGSRAPRSAGPALSAHAPTIRFGFRDRPNGSRPGAPNNRGQRHWKRRPGVPGDAAPQRRSIGAPVGQPAAPRRRARNVKARAAVGKIRAHGMGHIVAPAKRVVPGIEFRRAAVQTLELGHTCHHGRSAAQRSAERGPDEPRGAGVHTFDRPRARSRFFDKNTGCEVFGHGSFSCGRHCAAIGRADEACPDCRRAR